MKKLLKYIIAPNSANEDIARREYILNIITAGLAVPLTMLFLLFLGRRVYYVINNLPAKGISHPIFCVFIFSLWSIFFLSKRGFAKIGAYIFISILFLFALYISLLWGVNLPPGLLFYVLIIVMSGILISSKFAGIMTFIISLTVALVGYLQINEVLVPNLYWKNEMMEMKDIIVYVITFIVITIISVLSNKEIEKALTMVRYSEKELKKEKDLLEERVYQRTLELKKIQMEKMMHLYRCAEFGKLSSGIFHDLANPITAVLLNLEGMKDDKNTEITETKSHLSRAIEATKKMEDFILAIRKQIQKQETESFFSLNKEINQVIQIFSYKAKKNGIAVQFESKKDITMYGDAIKFSQLASNLLSNAIDSYENNKGGEKEIKIELKEEKDSQIWLTVIDKGSGISKLIVNKIFEPFFTTKSSTKGMGIGLSATKNIVEKKFGGTIEVESEEGKGARFIAKIPL